MKPKFYTLIFIAISSLLFACRSAGKLYDKGKYDDAVEVAVKKVQKKPEDGEMKALLQNAYRYAVDEHQNKIAGYANSNNDLKWEWMYDEYISLQKLYDAIRHSPEASRILQPEDYSSYVTTYKEKAGDVHYQRGLQWMTYNDRESYKKAYREFNTALRFKTDDPDIQQKSDEAYAAAVINVVIVPANTYRGYQYSSYHNNDFEKDVIRSLYNINTEFVKFYSDQDAARYNIRPDEVVEIRFDKLDIGRTFDKNKTREVSKTIVVKETVYKPDSVVKEYGKVYAKVTTTHRNMISAGSLAIDIQDSNGRRLWNESLRSDHKWSTEFSTFTGDARALSEEDKRLIDCKRENPPSDDDIRETITGKIRNDLVDVIRNHYRD